MMAVAAEKIKEDEEYEGVRVRLLARMENVRIPLQVDIGFGDALITAPGLVAYPTLLPMPAPQIQAYPMEAVIAEKLEAMVHLGMLNSRMKDFFDVWLLARTFPFEGAALNDSIHATFKRRGTTLDAESFDVLISELSADDSKLTQWRAFLNMEGQTCRAIELCRLRWAIREFASFPLRANSWTAARPSHGRLGGPWSILGKLTLKASHPLTTQSNTSEGLRQRVTNTAKTVHIVTICHGGSTQLPVTY